MGYVSIGLGVRQTQQHEPKLHAPWAACAVLPDNKAASLASAATCCAPVAVSKRSMC